MAEVHVGKVSYRWSLMVAVPLLVGVASAAVAVNCFVQMRAATHQLATKFFDRVADQIAVEASAHLRQAIPAADLVAATLAQHRDASPDAIVGSLLPALRANDGFSWITFSDDTGASEGVHRLGGGAFEVNESTIVDGRTTRVVRIIGADGTWSAPRVERETAFDPRARAWYRLAKTTKRRVFTEPYIFFDSSIPGVTCAEPVEGASGELLGVVTIDFDLNRLSGYIAGVEMTPNARAFIVSEAGTIVAHSKLRLVETHGKGDEGTLVTRESIADDLVREQFAARGAPAFIHGGEWYLSAERDVHVEGGPSWHVAVVVPESDLTGDANRTLAFSIAVSAASLVLAVLLAALLASRVARPLVQMAIEMDAVGRLELDGDRARGSMFVEIARMERALLSMKAGLRSFALYVPRDLVRRVLASTTRSGLGGETRVMSIFFSDLAGFTTLSESMSPEALVAHLGQYFDEMTKVIGARGGTIDKFIGDAIMAMWNAPEDEPAHAALACEAALRCQARLDALRGENAGFKGLTARVGVATGPVLVGNIGSHARMNYTVMGDNVNLASRLEGLNKLYGTRILVSEATFEAARDRIVMRAIDVVAVKGKDRGLRVYEPLSMLDDANAADVELAALFEAALGAYLDRRFEEAARLYASILDARPDEPPARVMRDRCTALAASPPGPEWSGVHRVDSK